MERPPCYDDDGGGEQRAREEEDVDAAAGPSTEQVFEGEPVPTPSEMITARSVAVSVVLGATLSVVAIKLSLSSGYLPLLTIPAGLLGFFLSRSWVRLLNGCEAAQLPFTRQENTVIQTFVAACSNIAYSGGFGSYILAMSRVSAEDGAEEGDSNFEEPSVLRLIAFLFLTSFAGMFAIMPFRNSLIIRHQLTFPTGTATAHLINSMHTPHGAKQASKQVSVMFKTFFGAMAWSVWQWLFTGGEDCGFKSFPIFGIDAARSGFSFDFSMTNIGIGLFSPYKITISMLLGSVASWGILCPYLYMADTWYDPGEAGAYRMFIGVSMVLADGLFHLLCILLRTLRAMRRRRHSRLAAQPFMYLGVDDRPLARSFDDRRRAQVFLRDRVFDPAAVAGYVALSAVATVAVPRLYPQLSSIHVAVAYLVAPLFAFCNAYGMGMTDVSVAPTYGKLAVLAFGSWVGLDNGGVVAGLAGGLIIVAAVCTATDLRQVFRTGYLTLTSPHAVLVSQVAGTALGCVINPLAFAILYGVYSDDDDGGASVAGYGKMYRGITIMALSRQGMPRYSVLICKISFALALSMSVLREVSTRRRWRVGRYLPCTIAVAVGIFLPPRIAIGMFVGSIVVYLWRRLDADGARMLSPAVAAGLICGDGIGSLLQSMLQLLKARPPICIMFLSRSENKRLDAYLAGSPTSS